MLPIYVDIEIYIWICIYTVYIYIYILHYGNVCKMTYDEITLLHKTDFKMWKNNFWFASFSFLFLRLTNTVTNIIYYNDKTVTPSRNEM